MANDRPILAAAEGRPALSDGKTLIPSGKPGQTKPILMENARLVREGVYGVFSRGRDGANEPNPVLGGGPSWNPARRAALAGSFDPRP